MFCPKCKKELADGTRFCPECGADCGASSGKSLSVEKINCSATIKNLFENSNSLITEQNGCFSIFEHQRDLSVTAENAVTAFYMQNMNVKKRQVLCTLNDSSVKIQSGAMQWMAGNISVDSGVKSVGSFFGNLVKSAVTGESVAKPIYKGTGYLMLEPTYKHLFIEDVSTWQDGIVLNDGLFLACESSLTDKVVKISDISSALLSGEGLFNLSLKGNGLCVLEAPVPREELIEVELNDGILKVDGNMAVAWSGSLNFSADTVNKSWINSGITGEGFVNIFQGTGKVLLAQTMEGTVHDNTASASQEKDSN